MRCVLLCVLVGLVVGCGPDEPTRGGEAPTEVSALRAITVPAPAPASMDDDFAARFHLHPVQGHATAAGDPSQHPGTGDPTICTCAAAKLVDGWCEFHVAGWVAGVRVRSAQLFETLDPHGHEIGHESVTCPTCREAIADDGYCDASHIGWQRGLAYLTRLTWLLAKGKRVTDEMALCSSCRLSAAASNSAEPRWCPTCAGGVVGNVFFAVPSLFEESSRSLGTLRLAVAECARCELCACAMVYDRRCPDCGISYVDGRPIEPPTPSDR